MTEFIIYKIYCKDETITDCYVGSTDNFDRRCGEHIHNCNNKNIKSYNYKVYKFIREHGGFDNFIIEEIIECDEENRYDCEVHYFLKLNAKLNSLWPRRNPQQRYNDNREKYNEKQRIKMQCECGSVINRGDIARHKKTKKHQNYISTK